MNFKVNRFKHTPLPQANADLPGPDKWFALLTHVRPCHLPAPEFAG